MVDEVNVFHISIVKLDAAGIVIKPHIYTINCQRTDEHGIHEHTQVMIDRKGLRFLTVLHPQGFPDLLAF